MSKVRKPTKTYLQLIERFPLRPIIDDDMLDQASELFSELAMKGLKRGRDEDDYLNVLEILIQKYEYEHSEWFNTSMTPQRALQSLMEDNSLSQSELARQIGTQQSIISEFLSGRRGLSKELILRLSEFFCLKPEYFLGKSNSRKVS